MLVHTWKQLVSALFVLVFLSCIRQRSCIWSLCKSFRIAAIAREASAAFEFYKSVHFYLHLVYTFPKQNAVLSFRIRVRQNQYFVRRR